MSQDFKNDIESRLAESAYQGISFSPERRGESARNEYAEHLAEVYKRLESSAQKGGTTDLLDKVFDTYRAGLRRRYSAFLAASSRCVSTMIAGPSNFPVRQMQKRSDIAQRRLGEYLEFSSKAIDRAIRRLRPDLAPIMTGDSDALDRLKEKLAKLEAQREAYKAHNKAARKDGKDALPGWALSNLGANIRTVKARIDHVERNQASETQVMEGNGIRIELVLVENRIKAFFPGKPDEVTRAGLKSHGFRWAPSEGCWKSYPKQHSLDYVKSLLNEVESYEILK